MNIRRVVLDTNIIVSALLTPEGNPAKIYTMFLSETISLVYSAKTIEEYQDVLYRPCFQFMLNKIETVLSAIRQYGKTVEPEPSIKIMIDEDDRIFYDVAKNIGAYLITGNTKHYPQESFILSSTEFLRLF